MAHEYQTKDLAEAGAIIMHGQELKDIKRLGKICWFCFDNEEKCRQISNKFFFGELTGNVRNYYEILNRLKNRIFS